MVVVKNLSTSVINSLPNTGGEILFNTSVNAPIVNTANEFKYFVLASLTGAVTGLSSISATSITGTLQTAAQPNVTSLGTLTGLSTEGNLNIVDHDGSSAGLQLNGTLVTATATQLNYNNVTPGTAVAGKALITDENNSIVGLSNLETDNLTVNGTLVTASAIELNYTDVSTIGVAQASKALVLDANKDIVGIHNLETDNLTVNGTLVTASALELNYTDVSTIGTAQAAKALVLDGNKDIVGINHLSATTLTGTLQTAAQPNITSVGTLTGLTVNGQTNLSSLTVGGVNFTPYGTNAVRTRVYSTPDFNGNIIHSELSNNVNFSAYAPAGQTSGYSMEVWGYIKPQYTESYTFSVTSNANFRLWINNNLVRTGWTSGAHNNLQSDPIALTADVWYPIYIQHVQLTDTEVLNISWTSTSQTSEIIPQSRFAYDNKEVTVTARKTYQQDVFTLYDSTNSYLSTIGVTTSGDLTLSPYSDNVNIPGHNGSTTGLQLNGTLVTSTATQLNYTNVTPGTAGATKALVVDANKDIGNIRNVRTIGNFGVNTTAADKQVEINNASGDCLRLSYDASSGNAESYVDFSVSSTGDLTMTAAGTNINVANALNVTGATALSSTLGVTGATTLSSTLGVTGATTLSSTLGVTGAVTFSNTTDSDSLSVGGCLTISGGAAVAKTLRAGHMVISGNLDVYSGATYYDNLRVNGQCRVANDLDATSSTAACALYTAGGVAIAKKLYVGTNLNIGGTSTLTGAASLSSTLGVTGATTLSSTLDVTGVINFNNVTDATSSTDGGCLTIDGGAAVAKKLYVGTKLYVGDTIDVTSDMTIGGVTNASGALNVTGDATLSSNLAVTGTTALSNTLAVTGATTLSSTLSATGAVTFSNTTDATSSTDGGCLTVSGGAAVAKKLYVGTTLTAGTKVQSLGILAADGPIYGSAGLHMFGGNVELDHQLIVTGATTLSSTLGVTGATTLSSTLSATGAITFSNTTDATSSTAGGCLTVSGGAAVAKKLFVGDTVDVTGAASLSSTLTVTGASTLSSTLGVTGATTLSNTLTVSGASTLSSSLNVTGAITFENVTDATSSTDGGCLTVAGGVAIAKKLYVGSDLSIGGNLTLAGTTTFSGNLVVGGTTTLDQTLDVTGATSLANTLAVTGATTLSSTLGVTGVINFNNTTDATSSTDGGCLTVAGGAAVAKKLFVGTNLNVGGTSTLTGAATLSNTLDVSGATTLSSTLGVTGAATLSSTLSASGVITFSNTTDATSSTDGGCVTVAGGAAVAKKLYVGGTLGVTGATTISSTLSVNGAGSFNNTLDVTGASTLTGALTLWGGASLMSSLSVAAGASFNSVVNISGAAYCFNSNDASSSTSGGSLTVSGGAAIAKKLFVGGTLGVTGATSLSSTLSATGAVNFSDTTDATSSESGGCLTVAGGAAVAKKLYVGLSASITGALNVASVTNLSGQLNTNSRIISTNTDNTTTSHAQCALTIAGGAAIAKNLYVGMDFSAEGNSNLAQNASVGNNLTVYGATTLSTTVAVTGAATLSSTLGVTGATTLSSSLSASGAITFSNTTNATSSTAGGCVTISGGAAVAKKLFVGETLNVTGVTTLGNNLIVTGPALEIPVGDTAARPSTPNAGTIRYNSETSQFEGFGPGESWGSLGGVTNTQQTTKILAEMSPGNNDNILRFINNTAESMRLTADGFLGVNTTAPSKQVEINSDNGECLRLTYNDSDGSAANYCDFSVSSGGGLNISSSSLTTTIDSSNNLDVASHNGTTLGLKLAGTLVTSSATQLNYNNVTPGTAAASKALILDSSSNIANINSMSVNNINTTFHDANTNTVGYPIKLYRTTSSTPATGLGVGMDFFIQNDESTNVSFGSVQVSANNVVSGAEEGQMIVNLMQNGDSVAAMTLTNTSLLVTEVVETSDRRVKENIIPVNNEESFNRLMDLNIVDYNFINDAEKRTHRGLIAQELAEVIPDAVTICEKDGIEDFHGVSTKELVGYLISSLQFMNAKFEALNEKYEDLKNNACRCNQ